MNIYESILIIPTLGHNPALAITILMCDPQVPAKTKIFHARVSCWRWTEKCLAKKSNKIIPTFASTSTTPAIVVRLVKR